MSFPDSSAMALTSPSEESAPHVSFLAIFQDLFQVGWAAASAIGRWAVWGLGSLQTLLGAEVRDPAPAVRKRLRRPTIVEQ